mgnify:CR=1 FL=1|jgi:hypothetical protein
MSFHKRHIDNDQVIEIYRRQGIDGVEDWYTSGVDALITQTGLASDVSDLIDEKMDRIAKWNMISEMISDASIEKGFDEKKH